LQLLVVLEVDPGARSLPGRSRSVALPVYVPGLGTVIVRTVSRTVGTQTGPAGLHIPEEPGVPLVVGESGGAGRGRGLCRVSPARPGPGAAVAVPRGRARLVTHGSGQLSGPGR